MSMSNHDVDMKGGLMASGAATASSLWTGARFSLTIPRSLGYLGSFRRARSIPSAAWLITS